jgi:hypothetical protein
MWQERPIQRAAKAEVHQPHRLTAQRTRDDRRIVRPNTERDDGLTVAQDSITHPALELGDELVGQRERQPALAAL